jgi:hypothetical protein
MNRCSLFIMHLIICTLVGSPLIHVVSAAVEAVVQANLEMASVHWLDKTDKIVAQKMYEDALYIHPYR